MDNDSTSLTPDTDKSWPTTAWPDKMQLFVVTITAKPYRAKSKKGAKRP